MAPRKRKAVSKRATRRKTPAKRAGAAPAPRARKARPDARPGAFPEVEALVELMNRHGLLEVDFESGAGGVRRIRVSRAGAAPVPGGTEHAGHAAAALAPPADAAEAGTPAPQAAREALHAFKSPMVGTFYRAPSPELPPFVSVGDSVDASTTVCIIEAMKVMNEIVPDVSGEIASIEVENGEAVEYGQTLFLLRTA